MRPLFACALLLFFARSAAAQDRAPALVDPHPAPRYPEVLRAAGIAGTIRMWVRVLPGDSVPADGVVILSSPHPGFAYAVRERVRRWRYQAALRSGVPAVDSLRVDLVYGAHYGAIDGLDSIAVDSLIQDSVRVVQVTLDGVLPEGRGAVPPEPQWRRAALAAMARMLEGTGPGEGGSPRIACVGFERNGHDLAMTEPELRQLRRPGVMVVVQPRCPPLYRSAIPIAGKIIPPGEDPILVEATEVRIWDERWTRVRMEKGGVGSGDIYQCVSDLVRPDVPVKCAQTGSWVF
ncbi:MAG TPA: energy transducer TonB [Gemmatimonadales bacterium]|nr:energy transducer TonB [Gemmatimonadales bacterium]